MSSPTGGFDDPHQTLFDRKTVVLPDIIAPADVSPENALKPAFDLMWQAAGFVGSQNYNNLGEWAPRQFWRSTHQIIALEAAQAGKCIL